MSRVCVLGSGAWGTALALTLARRGGHQITLWSHSEHISKLIRENGENTAYLPGFTIPSSIRTTSEASTALEAAEIVLSTMPSEHVRGVYAELARWLHPGHILVSATKGLEDDTHLRMSEVIAQSLRRNEQGPATDSTIPERKPTLHIASRVETRVGPGFSPDSKPPQSEIVPAPEDATAPSKVAVLSGPSFAYEVAAAMPTALTVACTDAAVAEQIQQAFSSPTLRVYTNEDVIGVELGGALKNVIAIATGIAAGLKLGHNAMAALITRGIAEVTRLAVACGGRGETLAGLSGVGDLVLTCTGSLSRNRTVGIALGQGRTLEEILQSLGGKVAEGVRTTPAALGLARSHGVEMPITEQMDAILRLGKDPRDAMRDLMSRPGRDE